MPVIVSNPNIGVTSIETDGIGSGDIRLNVTSEQLQLISAFLMTTRLGKGVYKQAAYELMNAISNEYGDDFLDEALEDVDLQVTIENAHGEVVLKTDDSEYFPTLEVS